MQHVSSVDIEEIVDLVLEAGRLARFGGTEAERDAFLVWKQDLIERVSADRISVEPRGRLGGGLG